MTHVTGIGGLFFRAKDPEALAAWYHQHLGIPPVGAPSGPWHTGAGVTAFAPFPADTDYFGRPDQSFMLNLRVRDLDTLLGSLREAGAQVEEPAVDTPYGRFGYVTDPEGNRVELWEPSA
ncbi:glyoxylase I family protein [Streptacidiphilus sp. MAP12-33]|uniref:VOC family protein n=1 Tax=Streptacidiphilus sp. MAP12-33 TaxID=3156266 RepID=UPI003517FB52